MLSRQVPRTPQSRTRFHVGHDLRAPLDSGLNHRARNDPMGFEGCRTRWSRVRDSFTPGWEWLTGSSHRA